MGIIRRNYKKDLLGDVITLDPKLLWVGTSDKCPHIKRFMGAEEAERWVKESSDRKVTMKLKKFEL